MGIAIKELSERSGVKIPTIRYYERQGLLPEPERTAKGQRRYGSVDVARLRFARFSRRLGLEIGEILALIEMVGEGNGEEIIVVAEAVGERAERMRVLYSSLQSVSAAIIAGAIDEGSAFDWLVAGEGTGVKKPIEPPPLPNSDATEASQDKSSRCMNVASPQENTSMAIELAAEELMVAAVSEGDAPETPLRKPKPKRTPAKS